jgi:O-antigen/teichoic acid export membrane protein
MILLVGLVASNLIWFLIKILIVRNLSKEELGLYSIAVPIISIISLIASVGLWEGTTRYIAVFKGEGRKKDADSICASSIMIGTASGVLCFLLVFFLAEIISTRIFYKDALAEPLRVLSLFIPFNVMALIFAAIVRGHSIITPKVYYMDIGQPLFLLAAYSLIFLLGLPFMSIMWSYVFSMVFVAFLIGRFASSTLGLNLFSLEKTGYLKALLQFSFPIMSVNIMSLIFRWTDTLMLGRYMRAEDVGVYSVGVSLSALLALPLGALGCIYLPIAGEMFAQKKRADLIRSYQILTKWAFILTLPVFFVIFFFPEMTITFLFGDQFLDASMPLRLLSIGLLFNAFWGPNSVLLMVYGLTKQLMYISLAGAIINILLNYLLIKHAGYGMAGAALSTMVSYIFINVMYSFILFRKNTVHPITSTYIKPILGSAVIGLAIYCIAKSLPLEFWMIPVYFILYLVGYLFFLFLTRSIDAEDLYLIDWFAKLTGIDVSTIKNFIIRAGLK